MTVVSADICTQLQNDRDVCGLIARKLIETPQGAYLSGDVLRDLLLEIVTLRESEARFDIANDQLEDELRRVKAMARDLVGQAPHA